MYNYRYQKTECLTFCENETPKSGQEWSPASNLTVSNSLKAMASDTTTVSCTLSPCTHKSGLMTSQNTSCLLSFCVGAVARIMVALDVIRKIRPINTVKGEVCFPNQVMPPFYTFQGQLWGGNSYQFAYSHGSGFFIRFFKAGANPHWLSFMLSGVSTVDILGQLGLCSKMLSHAA